MSDQIRRRWRFYETRSGRKPAKEFLVALPQEESVAVLAGMDKVSKDGLVAARHLTGDIYEVRVSGDRVIYRVLFATEGRHSQVLLALEAFTKKTQKTPSKSIALARKRLADWRARGRPV